MLTAVSLSRYIEIYCWARIVIMGQSISKSIFNFLDQKFQMKNQQKTLFPLIVVLFDSYLINPGQMQASLSLQDSSNLIYLIERTVFWILVLYYINFVWSVDEVQEKPQTINVFLKLTIRWDNGNELSCFV
jgi:hypothetical protein